MFFKGASSFILFSPTNEFLTCSDIIFSSDLEWGISNQKVKQNDQVVAGRGKFLQLIRILSRKNHKII